MHFLSVRILSLTQPLSVKVNQARVTAVTANCRGFLNEILQSPLPNSTFLQIIRFWDPLDIQLEVKHWFWLLLAHLGLRLSHFIIPDHRMRRTAAQTNAPLRQSMMALYAAGKESFQVSQSWLACAPLVWCFNYVEFSTWHVKTIGMIVPMSATS